MANTSLKLAFLTSALALGLSSAVFAEGPTASMLANTCAGCHGTNGASVGPASPTIAAMEKESFVETMKAFQSGDMYSTIMGRIAKGYTEDEITAMAGYFAEQEFVPAKQSFDEALVSDGGKYHEK